MRLFFLFFCFLSSTPTLLKAASTVSLTESVIFFTTVLLVLLSILLSTLVNPLVMISLLLLGRGGGVLRPLVPSRRFLFLRKIRILLSTTVPTPTLDFCLRYPYSVAATRTRTATRLTSLSLTLLPTRMIALRLILLVLALEPPTRTISLVTTKALLVLQGKHLHLVLLETMRTTSSTLLSVMASLLL